MPIMARVTILYILFSIAVPIFGFDGARSLWPLMYVRIYALVFMTRAVKVQEDLTKALSGIVVVV